MVNRVRGLITREEILGRTACRDVVGMGGLTLERKGGGNYQKVVL